MSGNLNANEEAQLLQTIEMFEIILQSDPNDCQSLEILKEAYSKLGRSEEVVSASKRLGKAYEATGQLSSAILEYENVLELRPEDPDVQAALGEITKITSRAESFGERPAAPEVEPLIKLRLESSRVETAQPRREVTQVDDGRDKMRHLFVDGKLLGAADFDRCWQTPDLHLPPREVTEPFVQALASRELMRVEESLKLLCDNSRLGYIPLDHYDMDVEWVRSHYPREVCQRWCILPFDRMSKSLMVATANPFNLQAESDLQAKTEDRLIWYLTSPSDLVKRIKIIFH